MLIVLKFLGQKLSNKINGLDDEDAKGTTCKKCSFHAGFLHVGGRNFRLKNCGGCGPLWLGRGYERDCSEKTNSFNSHNQTLHLADGTAAFITIHPSFLLRIEDDADKQREYENFVADLRPAARILRKKVA